MTSERFAFMWFGVAIGNGVDHNLQGALVFGVLGLCAAVVAQLKEVRRR